MAAPVVSSAPRGSRNIHNSSCSGSGIHGDDVSTAGGGGGQGDREEGEGEEEEGHTPAGHEILYLASPGAGLYRVAATPR